MKNNSFQKFSRLFLVSLFLLMIQQSVKAQKVYSVQYSSDADVKVYVTKYASDADLVVYKADYSSDAGDNNGVWFFTD